MLESKRIRTAIPIPAPAPALSDGPGLGDEEALLEASARQRGSRQWFLKGILPVGDWALLECESPVGGDRALVLDFKPSVLVKDNGMGPGSVRIMVTALLVHVANVLPSSELICVDTTKEVKVVV
jgi:hypothetical protein